MGPAEIGAWIAVAVGIVLSASGVRSTFYFGAHRRALGGTGGEWVVGAIHRTCATITFVCLGFTMARMVSLSFGIVPVLQLVQALLVIWLLTIPFLLMRLFQAKEGIDVSIR